MGMSLSTKPAKKNLTQLQRNTRGKKGAKNTKKNGRKKPRPNDVEPESLSEMHASKYSLDKFYMPYALLQMGMSLAEALDLLWECLNETDKLSGKKRPCVLLTVIIKPMMFPLFLFPLLITQSMTLLLFNCSAAHFSMQC